MPTRGPAAGGASTFDELRERLRGPWRVAVDEASMRPAIEAGDWLLVDPTVGRWPRRGAIVVFREPTVARSPSSGSPPARVTASPFEDGFIELADDEAWLVSDASRRGRLAAGFGAPIDSRRYGPVPLELLVGRAWFRYAPVAAHRDHRGMVRGDTSG